MNKFIKNFEVVSRFAELSELSKQVDGWLNDIEGTTLYTIAKFGPMSGEIVEIGSFKGKSTIWIAKGSKALRREKVYSIDPHKGSVENQPGRKFSSNMPAEGTTKFVFLENIKGAEVDDWIVPIVDTSMNVLKEWTKPVRFLFIDGDHRYKYVKEDFLGWGKHLIPGGVVAFHDYSVWPGPTKVVDQYLRHSKKYSSLGFIKSLSIYIKLK